MNADIGQMEADVMRLAERAAHDRGSLLAEDSGVHIPTSPLIGRRLQQRVSSFEMRDVDDNSIGGWAPPHPPPRRLANRSGAANKTAINADGSSATSSTTGLKPPSSSQEY